MKKLLFGLIALLSFYTCSKDNAEDTIDSPMKSTQQIIPCGDVWNTVLAIPTNDLIMPGTVIMQNDEFNLYVTIQTYDDWQLQMTHVRVGDCENLPLDYSTGPLGLVSILYGDFPYAEAHPAGTTNHTVIVPLQSLPNIICITVAASVVIVESGQIVQSENALTMEIDLAGGKYPFSYCYSINSCE